MLVGPCVDDRVAIDVLDTSPDALLELLFRSHPYVAQDRAGEMRNTIYSDRPIPQADNRLSTKRKPFCSNNRHIIGRENARKVVAAFEPFLDLRFHASFVNRQTRTKSVRYGLAPTRANWSGGWQRIINRSLAVTKTKTYALVLKDVCFVCSPAVLSSRNTAPNAISR
jgi:hypothetical protein